MAVQVGIDADALLHWSRRMDNVPRKTKAALARALNTIGDGVVTEMVAYIASKSGLNPEDIRATLQIKRATPGNTKWSVDASEVAPPSLDWSRPWGSPNPNDHSFDSQQLVKITTFGDENVCQLCMDVSERSPYTLHDAMAMRQTITDDGLIHPRCRCIIEAWNSMRRLPVVFGGSGEAPPQLMTMKKLGRTVAAEMQVVLKVE